MKETVGYDAVYPLGEGDFWEFKQSLRLLKKYAKGLRNVYVIGENPGVDGIIHVPFIEEDLKEINLWKKTLCASLMDEVSESFLYVHDDHFILEDIDRYLPDYWGGKLTDLPKEAQYGEAIQRTIDLLGPDAKNFDIHCPMFINKAMFEHMFNELFGGEELLLKSCYGNYWYLKGKEMEDLKFRNLVNRQQIEHFTRERWVFSTWEHAITADLKAFIEER